MKKLTILYDETCGFCTRVRWWMTKQPAFVKVEFLPAGGPDVRRRFPSLRREIEELIVIADDGAVYRGPDAFLMSLWALQEWRELAMDLASPALKFLARRAFAVLSGSRQMISKVLSLTVEDLRDEPTCDDGSCQVR